MTEQLRTKSLIVLLLCNTIGAGIFILPQITLSATVSTRLTFVCWILAGIVSILFGLCYSELGSTYPEEGGDAIYLVKAYGKLASIAFSFVSVVVILPLGCTLMIQMIGNSVISTEPMKQIIIFGILMLIATINVLGNNFIFRIQYVLTILKVLVVGFFVLFAFLVFLNIVKVNEDRKGALSLFIEGRENENIKSEQSVFPRVMNGLYATLWSYDGWNSGNFIANRVYRPARTFPVAIVASLVIVCFIYLLINLSFFYVLPYEILMKENIGLVKAYFDNLILPQALRNICIHTVKVLPCLGTLNGSFLVATCIIDSFIDGYKNKNLIRTVSVYAFGVLVFLLHFIDNPSIILDKISFCTYLFYGMSILGMLILRKKDKDAKREFRASNIIAFSCIAFSCVMVFFSIYKNFLSGQ